MGRTSRAGRHRTGIRARHEGIAGLHELAFAGSEFMSGNENGGVPFEKKPLHQTSPGARGRISAAPGSFFCSQPPMTTSSP